jgi:hypothetical protein
MNSAVVDLDGLVDYIFSKGVPPAEKIAIELEIQDENGGVETSVFDSFSLLMDMAIKGFVKLKLDLTDIHSAVRVLNPYFASISMKVNVRPFQGSRETIPPHCILVVSQKNGAEVHYCATDSVARPHALEDIYAIAGDNAIYFTTSAF